MGYIDYIYSERNYSCFIDISSILSVILRLSTWTKEPFFLVIVHLLTLHHYIILMRGM